MMGTVVEIVIHETQEPLADERVAQAMNAGFAAAARVATALSFHDPASALSRLNATAGADEVVVDAGLYDVLRLARQLFDASHGVFDCTVGARLVAHGLLPRHGAAIPAEAATFDDVVLLGDSRVMLRRPLSLDLGGIAKGYAVDRAIDALAACGIVAAVVNAGGDLRVLGDDPVPIGLRDLERGRVIEAGMLADGAIATSQAFRERRGQSEQSPSAIVDPLAGRFVDDARLYSVVAPTCVVADGLTKVLAVNGGLDAALLQAFDATALVH